jgi:hypothetical protein
VPGAELVDEPDESHPVLSVPAHEDRERPLNRLLGPGPELAAVGVFLDRQVLADDQDAGVDELEAVEAALAIDVDS